MQTNKMRKENKGNKVKMPGKGSKSSPTLENQNRVERLLCRKQNCDAGICHVKIDAAS